VVKTWAWCPSLSSRAVVSFSSPKNLYPFSEGEIGRYHRGADFVALGDKVEEQLPSGPLERDETQLVKDQHIHPPQTMVQQG
jgi:hypothetical protein